MAEWPRGPSDPQDTVIGFAKDDVLLRWDVRLKAALGTVRHDRRAWQRGGGVE
jgi:hypothetical protein